MSLKSIEGLLAHHNCEVENGLAMLDFVNIMSGKWRIPVVCAILNKPVRFTDIQMQIPTISPRMLSKELRELEANGIVIRKVYDTIPVKIEYSLTDSAKELETIFIKIVEWGVRHRASQMGRELN